MGVCIGVRDGGPVRLWEYASAFSVLETIMQHAGVNSVCVNILNSNNHGLRILSNGNILENKLTQSNCIKTKT